VLDDANAACPLLLGNDWSTRAGAIVDCRNRCISYHKLSPDKLPDSVPSFVSIPGWALSPPKEKLLLFKSSGLDQPTQEPSVAGLQPTPLSASDAPFGDDKPLTAYSDLEFIQLVTKLKIIDDSISDTEMHEVQRFLLSFKDVFALSVRDITSPANFEPIRILNTVQPVQIKNPYRSHFSAVEMKAIDDTVSEWLKAGIIELSPEDEIPIINNLLAAKKLDGTFRICMDPRPLNSATIPCPDT
jgi:hypothetical protein